MSTSECGLNDSNVVIVNKFQIAKNKFPFISKTWINLKKNSTWEYNFRRPNFRNGTL